MISFSVTSCCNYNLHNESVLNESLNLLQNLTMKISENALTYRVSSDILFLI